MLCAWIEFCNALCLRGVPIVTGPAEVIGSSSGLWVIFFGAVVFGWILQVEIGLAGTIRPTARAKMVDPNRGRKCSHSRKRWKVGRMKRLIDEVLPKKIGPGTENRIGMRK